MRITLDRVVVFIQGASVAFFVRGLWHHFEGYYQGHGAFLLGIILPVVYFGFKDTEVN